MLKTKRNSKRQELRNSTQFALQTSKIEKIPLSRVLFDELSDAIVHDRQAEFGLVKLSPIDLNVRFEKTLLEVAYQHSRDRICSQLILAGANPAYSPHLQFTAVFYDKVMKYLWNLHAAVGVFVAYLGLSIRTNSIKGPCESCQNTRMVGKTSCGHFICEACYWGTVVTLSKFQDPICPCCQSELSLNQNYDSEHELDLKTEIRKLALQTKYKFEQLPNEIVVEKKRVFRALPTHIVSCQYLGTFKAQRSQVLLKAALDGNVHRVKATIRAGVDLNAQNEYGQTALFIACWKGYHEMVELLLECGTNIMTPDFAGIFPEDVMHVNVNVDGYVVKGTVTELVDNSFQLDDFFTESFLTRLDKIYETVPLEKGMKMTCNDRKYYCDSLGWVQESFKKALDMLQVQVMPQMRFLVYQHQGGHVPPHIDLTRTDEKGITSTHTFILYLTDCQQGGETCLLTKIPTKNTEKEILFSIKPKRGRMIVYPHNTPHEGRPVVDVPKLLLRGELKVL